MREIRIRGRFSIDEMPACTAKPLKYCKLRPDGLGEITIEEFSSITEKPKIEEKAMTFEILCHNFEEILKAIEKLEERIKKLEER